MLIKESINIINNINYQFRTNSSIDTIIDDMFAPALWGSDSLVQRSSLHGRISLWVHSYFVKSSHSEKVKECVITAFLQFQQANPTLTGIAFPLRRALFLLSQPATLTAPIPLLNLNPEAIENHRWLLQSQSLVSDVRGKQAPITKPVVEAWLKQGLTAEGASGVFDLILEYCPHLQPSLAILQRDLLQMEEFKKTLLTYANQKDTFSNVEDIAQSVLDKIHGLQKGEKWIYCSSLGINSSSIFRLLRSLNQLPDIILTELPSEMRDAIYAVSQCNTPEEYMGKHIHGWLDSICKSLDMPSLFRDEKRSIPKELRDELPEIYAEFLNHVAKNGILESVLHVLPKGHVRDFVVWLNQNLQELSSPNNVEKLKELEEKFIHIVFPFFESGLDFSDETLQGVLHSINEHIPPHLLEMLGLDSIFSQGNFWIQFERTHNGMDIQIYSSGNALLYHPHNSVTDGVLWPINYNDIPSEKLDLEWITGLVSQTLEGLINPKINTAPKDIFQGVLKSLSHLSTPSLGSLVDTSRLVDTWDFLFHYLEITPQKISSKYVFLKELFLGYVNHLKGGTADISLDDTSLNHIEQLLALLKKEADLCKDHIPAIEIVKLSNTQQWILFERKQLKIKASQKIKTKFVLPESIIPPLKAYLDTLGLNAQKWDLFKSMLKPVFGSGIGKILDMVGQDILDYQPQNIENVEEIPSQGWLKSYIQRLYLLIAYNTYRTAVGFTSEERSSEHAFFQYTKAAHNLLLWALPSPIKEWYNSTINYLLTYLTRFFLTTANWILSLLLGREGVNALKVNLDELQIRLDGLISHIEPKPKLSFNLDGNDAIQPIECPLPATPNFITVKPKSHILKAEFAKIYPHVAVHPFPEETANIHAYLKKVLASLAEIDKKSFNPILKPSFENSNPSNSSPLNPSLDAQYYAFVTVLSWPVPSPTEISIWSEISNPLEVMEDISQIMAYANQSKKIGFISTKEKSTYHILRNFTALSILDYLARHCDPLLEGYPVFAYTLLKFTQEKQVFKSGEHVIRARQLCKYFFPTLDVTTLPKIIYKSPLYHQHIENCLFYFIGKNNKTRKNVLKSMEGEYYTKLIGNRPFATLFPENNEKRFHPEHLEEAILLLENESNILLEEFSPIPRAFALLKRQTFISNSILEGVLHPVDLLSYSKPLQQWNSLYSPRTPIPRKSFWPADCFLPITSNNQPIHHREIPNSLHSPENDQHHIMKEYYRTGISIIDLDFQHIKIKNNDSFLRAIEYLQLHFDKLLYYDKLLSEVLISCSQLDFSFLTYDSVARMLQILENNIRILRTRKSLQVIEWIFFGIRFRKLVPAFHFKESLTFPSFQSILLEMVQAEPDMYAVAWELIVHDLPDCPSKLSEAEKKIGVKALLLAHFQMDKNYKDVHGLSLKMLQWGDVIHHLLDDPDLVNEVGNDILTLNASKLLKVPAQHFEYMKTTLKGREYQYLGSEHYILELQPGLIYFDQKSCTQEEYQNILLQTFLPFDNYQITAEGAYLSSDGKKRIEKTEEDEFSYRKKYKLENGCWYSKYKNFQLPPAIALLIKINPSVVYLRETSTKDIILRVNKNISLSLQKDSETKTQIRSIRLNHQTLIPISPERLTGKLQALIRFNALKDIQCWVDATTGKLKHILLLNKQLSITIEMFKGEERASILVEGIKYFISDDYFEDQKILASFLRLEDVNGGQFVVVPHKPPVFALCSMFVENLHLRDEFVEIAKLFLSEEMDPNPQEKEKIYLFQIDSNGHLYSSDPLALAYCLNLYLFQGNFERFQQCADKLIYLSTQGPLPSSLLNRIECLAIIPPKFAAHCLVRRKLLCAIATNDMVYRKNEEKNLPKNKESNLSLLFVIIVLQDLQAQKKLPDKERFTDEQEWFLFKFIQNSLIKCLDDQKVINNVDSMSSIPREAIFYLLNTSDYLRHRIKALSEKYEFSETLPIRSLRLYFDAYKQSFPVPQKTDITPDCYVDGLWNKYISQLIKNKYLKIGSLYFIYKDILINPPPAKLSSKGFRECLIPSFLAYYKIVRDRTQEFPHLRKLIQCNLSGWSPESRLLIHILSLVSENNFQHPSVEKFKKHLFKDNQQPEKQNEYNKQWALFEQFILDILSSQFTRNMMSVGIHEILGPILKMKMWASSAYPLQTDSSTFLFSLLKIAGKVTLGYCKSLEASTTALKRAERLWVVPQNLQNIDIYEEGIEDMLKTIYESAFETVDIVDPYETFFTLFKTPKVASEAEKIKFQHINQSLVKYYTQKNRIPPKNKFKSLDDFWNAFTIASAIKNYLKDELENIRTNITHFLNPPGLSYLPSFSIRDLRQAILDEDFHIFDSKLNFTPDAIKQLTLQLVLSDVIESRLDQVNRIMQHFDGTFTALNQRNGRAFCTHLEQLGIELTVKRAYKFTAIPFRLSFLFLSYERSTQHILWPKQAKAFIKQLTTPHKHVVTELMPSFGKTALALGLQKAYFANRKQVPVTTVLEQHASTQFSFVSKQCQNIYGLQDTLLKVHRSHNRTGEEFQAIYLVFVNALKNRASISVCKSGIQSLELESFIHGYSLLNLSTPNIAQSTQSIEALQRTLAFNKTYSIHCGDEWHNDADPNREMIYPVGNKLHLQKNLEKIILYTVKCFVSYPGVLKLIIHDELKTLSPTKYTEIITAVAKELSTFWQFNIHSEEERSTFVNYVTDECAELPPFIEAHPFWNEISTIRGVLAIIIKKSILPYSVNVDYGIITSEHLADDKKDDCKEAPKLALNASPFIGNNAPLFDHTLQLPYEDYVKSFFSYIHQGINHNHIYEILKYLINTASAEAYKNEIPLEETFTAKYFAATFPHIPLKNEFLLYDIEELSTITKALQRSPEACYLFHRVFVSKDISYWERYAHSNAINFTDMFSASRVQTGTPHNYNVYFPGTHPLFDKGNLGEMLHLISNRCRLDKKGLLAKDTPEKLLDEILNRYFTHAMNATLLVDGAPLFKGILNIKVAHKIADFCLQNKLDKQAVVFYHKNELVYMDIQSRTLHPFSECKIPPERYITYLDDPHGLGSNVATSGNAVNTVGEQPFFKLMQEDFRLRELKKNLTLYLEGDLTEFANLFNTLEIQEIFFVLLEETAQNIPSENDLPTPKELFAHSLTIECKEDPPNNYEALLQKIHNVTRRAIVNKMIFAPSVYTFLDILKTYLDFLIPKTNVDPIKLFGWQQKDTPTHDAIEITKDNMLAVIQNTKWFSEHEITSLRSVMDSIPIPPVPPTVRTFTYKNKTETFVNNQLNKQVSVNLQNEQNSDTSLQIQQQKNSQLQPGKSYYSSYREKKWNMSYNPRSLDWINTHSKNAALTFAKQSLNRLTKNYTSYSNINIYPFSYICNQAKHLSIKTIAPYFDKRLWASENFIPLHSPLIGSTKPFQLRHCNAYEILLHFDGTKIISAGCLSQKDANRWRKFLSQPRKPNDLQVILYDLFTRTKACGDDIDMDSLRSNTDFNLLEIQILFFNGNTKYPQELQQPLLQWLQKHPIQQLASAMKIISQRMPRFPYEGSHIDLTFAQLLNIPLSQML